MSLPARKQPGEARRRRKRRRLQQVKRRLLGLQPWSGPGSGQSIIKDVKRMIELLKKDKLR